MKTNKKHNQDKTVLLPCDLSFSEIINIYCCQMCVVCVSAGCQAVWSQKKAVLLWPQLWTPTPPIWESWTWSTIIQETQESSNCLLYWRIQAGDWTLWGMKSPAAATVSQCETLYLDCRWFSGERSALFIPVVQFSSGENWAWHLAKSCKWREEDNKNRWRSVTRRVYKNYSYTSFFSLFQMYLSDFLASGLASWWSSSKLLHISHWLQRIIKTLTLHPISTMTLLCYDINNNNRRSVSDLGLENFWTKIQKIYVTHKWI